MAAPMISGLVADLLQEHPSWTPDQVKGALTSSLATVNPAIQVSGPRLALMATPPKANVGLTPSSLITRDTTRVAVSG